ncbi:hypothetical protein K2173_024837 [Erythroxylum novogranatense]|uniref:Peroxiredoxin n=1 Tax=Erythroxylum novogranatense TaxID=1862640 RepID=A0AAV8UFX4_9ROSI|nr:hypothetical protein K2173_024837 [Erythroxylum novogranatense]
MSGLTIGDTIPNLELETTHGVIKLHDYINTWTILFSHPGLSCDDVVSHVEWIKDIEAYSGGSKVTYPIIADPNREAIKELNMVDPDEKDSSGNNLPSRALHIVGPDKKIKLSLLYPATTGRNMDKVMRVLDSLKKAEKYKKIATPANWKPGDDVVISASVFDEDAKKMFPQGFNF